LLQILVRTQIGSHFLGAQIDQVHLQRRAGFQPPQQKVHAAPQRFGGLEIRVVQQRAHRIGERGVYRGEQRRLLRIGGGHDERCDDAAQQRVHIAGGLQRGTGPADEAREVVAAGAGGR
jgi:hypothetical protein